MKGKGKVILLRDYSQESQEAEKILKELKIDHAQLFCSEGCLPSIISPDSAYAFDGIGGVRLFVSELKNNLLSLPKNS